MIYGYCRVSTKGQLEGNSIEDQEKSIKAIYPDAQITVESYSGAKERELFNELTSSLEKDDLLVVTKLDRFCRSTKAGLQHIEEITQRGAKIHILNMGLIEDTPMGKLIITNLLAFAEFERAMIVERTQSGKAIARTKDGFTEGRPKKYNDYQIQNAISLLNEFSYKKVEQMTGISKSTLIRAKYRQDKHTVAAK